MIAVVCSVLEGKDYIISTESVSFSSPRVMGCIGSAYLGWSLHPHQSFGPHPIPTLKKYPLWRDIGLMSRTLTEYYLYSEIEHLLTSALLCCCIRVLYLYMYLTLGSCQSVHHVLFYTCYDKFTCIYDCVYTHTHGNSSQKVILPLMYHNFHGVNTLVKFYL